MARKNFQAMAQTLIFWVFEPWLKPTFDMQILTLFYHIPFIKYHLSYTVYQIPYIKYYLVKKKFYEWINRVFLERHICR